jgi:energy-coupling factor transport system ATP-binding protein
MIRFSDVGYEYGEDTPALCGASLELGPGGITAVVGPNGSGKSTLAQLMMGLLLPTRGLVEVDGHDTRVTPPSVIRRLVSLAWQNPDNQLVCGVVEDDIAFGPENLGLSPSTVRNRVDEILSRLELTELRRSSIHNLSSAQKQVLAVAGAMAIEPRYLILDEVTSRLDPAAAHTLLDALACWAHDHQSGIIMITHLMSEVLRAGSVCRLETRPEGGGYVAMVGSPQRILHDAKFSETVTLETPLYDILFRLDQLGVRLNGTPENVDGFVDLLCR